MTFTNPLFGSIQDLIDLRNKAIRRKKEINAELENFMKASAKLQDAIDGYEKAITVLEEKAKYL